MATATATETRTRAICPEHGEPLYSPGAMGLVCNGGGWQRCMAWSDVQVEGDDALMIDASGAAWVVTADTAQPNPL